MNKGFLDNLICPHCGRDLSISERDSGEEEAFQNAVVTCGCSRYPVVGGILYLKRTLGGRTAADLLLRKKPRQALMALVEDRRMDRFPRVASRLMNFLDRHKGIGSLAIDNAYAFLQQAQYHFIDRPR